MKKIVNFFILSVFTLILFSCSTDNNPALNAVDEIYYETVYVDLIPSKRTNSTDDNAITYSVKLNYNFIEEKLESIEASEALLNELKMSNEMFSEAFFKQLELENETKGRHSDCIENCNDKYDKGEGRGKCKFNCWVDTTVELIKAIAELVR